MIFFDSTRGQSQALHILDKRHTTEPHPQLRKGKFCAEAQKQQRGGRGSAPVAIHAKVPRRDCSPPPASLSPLPNLGLPLHSELS